MIKSLFQKFESEWPPPPHNPQERCSIGQIDQWDVRIFSRQDIKYGYFSRKGMLHLQLWHPILRISVLTPSHLSAQHYEIFPIRNWKFRICCLDTVNEILQHHLEAPTIDPLVLGFMQQYFVLMESQADSPQRVIKEINASANEEAKNGETL